MEPPRGYDSNDLCFIRNSSGIIQGTSHVSDPRHSAFFRPGRPFPRGRNFSGLQSFQKSDKRAKPINDFRFPVLPAFAHSPSASYNSNMTHLNSEFARVAIVGVGLIGGSIALAARKWGGAETVIGYGRNRDRLAAAQNRGVIDEIATTPEALRNADLIVVCTPVDRIAEDVLTILRATDGTPALVTDAGSVKNKLQQAVDTEYSCERYIGAHPLAGSHHTGFEHASANLFLTRMCIVSPRDYPEISPEASRICRFWEQIGMKVKTMSAAEHDRILALTSHLPHLTASAVASIIAPDVLTFAATG